MLIPLAKSLGLKSPCKVSGLLPARFVLLGSYSSKAGAGIVDAGIVDAGIMDDDIGGDIEVDTDDEAAGGGAGVEPELYADEKAIAIISRSGKPPRPESSPKLGVNLGASGIGLKTSAVDADCEAADADGMDADGTDADESDINDPPNISSKSSIGLSAGEP